MRFTHPAPAGRFTSPAPAGRFTNPAPAGHFNVRDLVYIGVFGALWGVVEITLGSVLHMLNIPFAGAVLTCLGLAVAFVGRMFVPQRGSILFIGVVTAILKMFSIGGVVFTPVLGILVESLIAEAIVSAAGQPRRATFVIAGILATMWAFLQPFVTFGLVAGQGLSTLYERTISKAAPLLGLSPTAGLVVLGALLLLHVVLGTAAGWIGWSAGQGAQARIRLAEAA